MIITAIDPGLNGAMVTINSTGKLLNYAKLPTKKLESKNYKIDKIFDNQVFELMLGFSPTIKSDVYIVEDLRKIRREWALLQRNFKEIVIILENSGRKIHLTHAQTWSSWIKKQPEFSHIPYKEKSSKFVSKSFFEARTGINDLLKKDDGIFDAFCIAQHYLAVHFDKI